MKLDADTSPIFSARLTPHHSLSSRGLRVVVAVAVAGALVPGLISLALGAWPVPVFMAVGLVTLYLVLKRAIGRDGRFEEVVVKRGRLDIRRVFPSGFESNESYEPGNVRLVVERDIDERTTGLKLRTPDRDSEIGAFLDPADRASFARVFGRALRQARQR